jgi:hypothetical protein
MIFKKRGFARAVNDFSPKDDVSEVLAFVRSQRVPGEIRIVLPGNGGITSIAFHEKEQSVDVAPQSS